MKKSLKGLCLLLTVDFLLAPSISLSDRNEPVSQIVEYLAALAETPGETAYLNLLKFSNHENPVIRAACVQSLGYRGNPRAIPEVKKALNDPNETVRMYAVIALRALNIKDQVILAQPLLNDPDPFVRIEAIRTYLALAGKDSLPEILEAAKDPDYRVRATATQCLGELSKLVGSAKVIPHLILILPDSHKIVRTYAAQALGEAGDTRAIGPLKAVLKDPEITVREAAAESLKRLGVKVSPPETTASSTSKSSPTLEALPPVSPASSIYDLTRDDITNNLSLTSKEISLEGLRIGDDLRKATQILGEPSRQNLKKQTWYYPGLTISYSPDQRIREIAISIDYAPKLAPPNRELLSDRIAQDEQFRRQLLGTESEISIEEINVFGAEFQHYTYTYEHRGIQLKITDAKGKKSVASLSFIPPVEK